jgi:hypothetical protein
MRFKTLFYFRTSGKEPLTIILPWNDVYHQYKTDFICFDFHAYLGWIISKLAKILEHNLWKHRESGFLSQLYETLGGLKL